MKITEREWPISQLCIQLILMNYHFGIHCNGNLNLLLGTAREIFSRDVLNNYVFSSLTIFSEF
jgi:hypothetical protein